MGFFFFLSFSLFFLFLFPPLSFLPPLTFLFSHQQQGFQQNIGGSSVTYISRLQSVQVCPSPLSLPPPPPPSPSPHPLLLQSAIETQIRKIAKEEPNKKVGIITFSDSVTIFGDCGEPPVVVAGDNLKDIDYLMEKGYVFF